MRRASRRYAAVAALAAVAATAAPGAVGQALSDWALDGYNTIRLENYEASGDPAGSPYPSLGGQFNDDLGVVMSRQPSAWERQQIQLDGTLNESEYRGPERGLVLERARLLWEKGDTALPFRLELGDLFAFQSPRTVQQGLKGVQLELQPATGGAAHSLQAFAGITDRVWRGLDDDVEWYAGLSWLTESEPLGALSVNVVHNRRDADLAGGASRQQSTFGIAWNREFAIADQRIEVDGEYTRFAGDHGVGTGGFADDRSDDGIFAQVRGSAATLPFDWRLRFERYGEDYRPNGASITPDHRRAEAHGAWRFEEGRTLRVRAQAFTDALESANPVDTRVLGASVTGALLPGTRLDVTGSVDGFVQSREDRSGVIDTDTRSLRVSAVAPVDDAVSARLGLSWTATDAGAGRPQTVRREASAALDADLARGAWRATVSAGLVLRHDTGGETRRDDWGPEFALTLGGRGHRLQAAWSTLEQDAHAAGGSDNLSHRASAAWTWTRGRHRLGVDTSWSSRKPSPGADSKAWRIGATWTVSFERPAAARGAAWPAAPAAAVGAGPLGVADIGPGDPLDTAVRRLVRARAGSPASRPGLLIYETRLFETVERRQRFAVVHDGVRVDRTALVVDLDRRGDGRDASDTFEELREALLRRYGPAQRRIEEGEFGAQLAADLDDGRFVRLIEWKTRSGILRFGIPWRSDGVIRIEVQHAAGFAPGKSTDWSLEALR